MVGQRDKIPTPGDVLFCVEGETKIYLEFAHTYFRYFWKSLKKLTVSFACEERSEVAEEERLRSGNFK